MDQIRKILIADDEENFRNAIKRILRDLSFPFEVEEAYDGIDAEEKAKEFCPDLVILDLQMPRKGGCEVCYSLRELPEFKHLKIIGVSGCEGIIGGNFIKALGADCYFEKPFDNKTFVNKIEKLLSKDKL